MALDDAGVAVALADAGDVHVVALGEGVGLHHVIVVRGAIPGPKGGLVTIRSTAKTIIVKKGDAGISANPQKASARVNPQKASGWPSGCGPRGA